VSENKIAFVIGSPRSGTTLLGEILGNHPQIAQWYEPVFVWEHFFRDAPDDCRTPADATKQVKEYIRRAFTDFLNRSGKDVIIDKSPSLCMKIPFILEVFPNAQFIHIIRDGRDTILSIYREWQKRKEIITDRKKIISGLDVMWEFLSLQPYWDYRLAALFFEIGPIQNLFKGRNHLFYRLERWHGIIGWGIQFKGWQEIIQLVSCLEFCTYQWVKAVEAILDSSLYVVPTKNVLEIRYEDLLKSPQKEIKKVCDYIEMPFTESFVSSFPKIMHDNAGKWKKAFSEIEQRQIGNIADPLLRRLGYLK